MLRETLFLKELDVLMMINFLVSIPDSAEIMS